MHICVYIYIYVCMYMYTHTYILVLIFINHRGSYCVSSPYAQIPSGYLPAGKTTSPGVFQT